MSSKNAHENSAGAALKGQLSLAARLTVWYVASAFTVVLGVTAFMYWALADNLSREEDQFLANEVEALRLLLRERPNVQRALEREVELAWTGRQYVQVYVRILDESGNLLLETTDMGKVVPDHVFESPLSESAGRPHGRNVKGLGDEPLRVMSATASVGQSGDRQYVLHVALDLANEEELLAGYRHKLWTVLAVALIVCSAGGYQIGRLGMRPIMAITAVAERIGSSTLHERLATTLPTEVASLAFTFNRMLDRLQDSFERLSQFSADIAHELRTPVNNLRGELEVTLGQQRSADDYREVLSSCLEESENLARMIDGLLFIARAEHPETEIAKEPLNIAAELTTAHEFFEAAAQEKGIALTTSAPHDLEVQLNRTLFQRAVSNLVANALAYTDTGGAVTITARDDKRGVRVEVADTGIGIPPDKMPRIFDRFVRVDWSRSSHSGGVGLGLSIVRSIAVLHGGNVEIESIEGKGTRVVLTFPHCGAVQQAAASASS
jgi:two-component system heavy metal sensor histidine kinase CusS